MVNIKENVMLIHIILYLLSSVRDLIHNGNCKRKSVLIIVSSITLCINKKIILIADQVEIFLLKSKLPANAAWFPVT